MNFFVWAIFLLFRSRHTLLYRFVLRSAPQLHLNLSDLVHWTSSKWQLLSCFLKVCLVFVIRIFSARSQRNWFPWAMGDSGILFPLDFRVRSPIRQLDGYFLPLFLSQQPVTVLLVGNHVSQPCNFPHHHFFWLSSHQAHSGLVALEPVVRSPRYPVRLSFTDSLC